MPDPNKKNLDYRPSDLNLQNLRIEPLVGGPYNARRMTEGDMQYFNSPNYADRFINYVPSLNIPKRTTPRPPEPQLVNTLTYFNCKSNDRYHNPEKNYTSYFLSFSEGDCRIELMSRPDIVNEPLKRGFAKGIAHFDIEVGNGTQVDILIERFRADGHIIASEPRKTGDGYYEAGVLDPEGNYIEISAIYKRV